MALSKKKIDKNDPDLHKKAQNFSSYIDIVWKKIQENKIEDVDKISVKLQKCVAFFAIYIKYMPEYGDKVMYLCRSILILIESKNLVWEIKDFAKLIMTCCMIMVFQKNEEIIRESCIVTKEVLLKVNEDSMDEIVQKCSNFLIVLMQRVLTARTRLTQAMILEVMFRLTKNAKKIRNGALKKLNFFTLLDPAVGKLLMNSFNKINHENIEETSREFLMTLNLVNQKCGIFTSEGCVYKINAVEETEADIVHIDFNGRAKTVSFTIETHRICGALSETNIHYSTSKDPAYFEIFFDHMELLPAEFAEDEMNLELNVRHLMYKQDMNSALHEIDEVSTIQLTILGDSEKLAKFKSFYDNFICDKSDGNCVSQPSISDDNVSKVDMSEAETSTTGKHQEPLIIDPIKEVLPQISEKEIVDVPSPNLCEQEMMRSQEAPSELEIDTHQPEIENINFDRLKRLSTENPLKRKHSVDVYEMEDEELPMPSYKYFAKRMREKRAHLGMVNHQVFGEIELTASSSSKISTANKNLTKGAAKTRNKQDELKVMPHNSVERKSKGSVKKEIKLRGRPRGSLKKSAEKTNELVDSQGINE